MPAARPLFLDEAAAPLADFPLALRLAANRIVAENERQRTHLTTCKPDFVTPPRRQIDRLRSLLPAPDLHTIVRLGRRVKLERFTDVVTRPKTVLHWPEVEELEINRVEPVHVDALNGLAQRQPRPRALAKLVGVVMDKPGRVQLGGELHFPAQDALPLEPLRGAGAERVG